MRYLLLILTLFSLACEPPQTFEDDEDMAIRQNRNPPVLPAPPRGIPQVVATTPREGLWSGYNQLGYQAKYGPDNRGQQTILKLDEWGPPDVWTISLYMLQKFRSFNGYSVKAQIYFGCGGSTQTVEIDWANGAQISLPMNAVNVMAIFQGVDVLTEGAGLELGVQLARGARGGTAPPTLTLLESATIDAGANLPSDFLPAFARNLYLVPAARTPGNIAATYNADVLLGTISGTAGGTFDVASISGAQLGLGMKLPVTGSARRYAVRNNSATPINVALIAEIDG